MSKVVNFDDYAGTPAGLKIVHHIRGGICRLFDPDRVTLWDKVTLWEQRYSDEVWEKSRRQLREIPAKAIESIKKSIIDPEDDEEFLAAYSPEKMSRLTVGGVIFKLNRRGAQFLSAKLIEYLCAHPDLFPEEWEGKAVIFGATACEHLFTGGLCVRCLRKVGEELHDGIIWLSSDLKANYAVAAVV